MSDHNMRDAIREAIGAHGTWKLRLKTAVLTGRGELSAREARCDDRCAFGRWLHSDQIDDATRQGKPYRVIRRLHAEFHDAAGQVLAATEQGDSEAAAAILQGPFTERSDTLKVALTKWLGEIAR